MVKWAGVAAAASAVGLLAAPGTARACGGFFCSSAPMDQSGERIVFSVEDDGTTTTHVQILYQGTAESFAWIVPVPSLPEVSVGTDALFQQVDQGTAPRFQVATETTGTCRSRPHCSPPTIGLDGGGGGWSDAAAAWDASSSADGGPPPGVEVHFRDDVGPYDAAVLSSGDPDALRTWLADNGYDIPAESLPLIDHYVEKRDYFVALKLLTDRRTGEIQPIVLRYEERQPCIPIRLTAIAAVSDMPITAWVLADARALPYNYMSLSAPENDRRLYSGTLSYVDAVTRAVDDAGGRAFVTDYAGGPPSVSLALPDVSDLRDVTDPGQVIRRLRTRGYAATAQLLGILVRHIPPPDGVSAQDFYNCLVNDWCTTYDEHLATLTVDFGALVDDIDELIRIPREQAEAMVARHPKITRLFTTMSPGEMTEDPVFVLRDSSPDVARTHTARRITECGPEYFRDQAPQKLVLPNGDEHVERVGTPYEGTDDEYCLARTGYDASGCPPEGCDSDGDLWTRDRSGCATAGGGLGGGAAALVLAAAGLLARRRRRHG